MAKKNLLIFDVESTSLYGDGFAVGAIVANDNNEILHQFELFSTEGAKKSNMWVRKNVLPALKSMPKCTTLVELRSKFYEWYLTHKDTCTIWSDVNYPVETNFLSAIAKDDKKKREFNMPYPLYDICNFVNVNVDRSAQVKYMGLKKHNPLHDAMASYYALIDSTGFKVHGHNIQKW